MKTYHFYEEYKKELRIKQKRQKAKVDFLFCENEVKILKKDEALVEYCKHLHKYLAWDDNRESIDVIISDFKKILSKIKEYESHLSFTNKEIGIRHIDWKNKEQVDALCDEHEKVVCSFFEHLDSLTPDMHPVLPAAKNNLDHFTFLSAEKAVSFAQYPDTFRETDEAIGNKRIVLKINDKKPFVSISDMLTIATHEVIHSLSDAFKFPLFTSEEQSKIHDINAEYPSVIGAALSANYYSSVMPECKSYFAFMALDDFFSCIKKIQGTLASIALCKVIAGEKSLKDTQKEYGKYVNLNTSKLKKSLTKLSSFIKDLPESITYHDRLEKIEDFFFNDRYVRYYIPHMLAFKAQDLYQEDPHKAATILKDIIENDLSYTPEDIIKKFGYSSREECVDDFCNNLDNRFEILKNNVSACKIEKASNDLIEKEL